MDPTITQEKRVREEFPRRIYELLSNYSRRCGWFEMESIYVRIVNNLYIIFLNVSLDDLFVFLTLTLNVCECLKSRSV